MTTNTMSEINHLESVLMEIMLGRNNGLKERVMKVCNFLADEVEYDRESITYDENGKIVEIKDKTPAEVARTRKATCMSGVFYAARELRDYFGEEMIVLVPLIRKKEGKEIETGVSHGMYLFRINGLYGAVSKSREKLLEFVSPIHETKSSIAISPEILVGYNRLLAARGERFSGITCWAESIREKYPNYDEDASPSNEDKERMAERFIFRDAKKIPTIRKYLADHGISLD